MGTKQFDNYADLITFTRASGATYLDSDGVLKTASTNIPRIEYDADGNRLGLLVEEQRTNLLTYSEDFSQWINSNSSDLTDQNVAPDGNIIADKLIDTITDSGHTVYKTVSPATGVVYVFSCYLKAAELNYATLALGTSSGIIDRYLINIDLSTGTITDTHTRGSPTNTAYFDSVHVGNGWYRCAVAMAHLSSSLVAIIGTNNSATVTPAASGDAKYVGDGTSGVYIWGAQVEAGAFPTSYIPTSGSTATRAEDDASIPTRAFGYNASEGTVVVEVSDLNQAFTRIFNLDSGSDDDMISVFDTGVDLNIYNRSGAVTSVNVSIGVFSEGSKIGYAFSSNDYAGAKNGVIEATDSFGELAGNINSLEIGKRRAGRDTITGHIKSIKYYPRRLTNAQLVELTQ
jgi:hypothetical protein